MPVLQLWMQRAGIGVQDLVEEGLLVGFLRLWVELVFNEGLRLDAHAQNLVLVVSARLEPLGGLSYRDFEGLAGVWVLRRARCTGARVGKLEHVGRYLSRPYSRGRRADGTGVKRYVQGR